MGRSYSERVEDALAQIREFGGIDGAHHKQWLLDQIVRTLTDATKDDQDDYLAWLAAYENGSDGPNTYTWDTGIAP